MCSECGELMHIMVKDVRCELKNIPSEVIYRDRIGKEEEGREAGRPASLPSSSV